MTTDEVYKNGEISVRSYNVCRYNGLFSLENIYQYYLINRSFEKLRNCGRRSNDELIAICKKYQKSISENDIIDIIDKNPLEKIILNLTKIQENVINSFIIINTNSLSVRSKNAISQFLNYDFNIQNFSNKILLDKFFNISLIKNIGKKSIDELDIYISKIYHFIENVTQYSDEEQLITLKNNFLIQQTYSISEIPPEISKFDSIFLVTNFLLDNNAFFSENQTIILKQTLKIYKDKKVLSLEEAATKNNLTRERVRQIRNECLDVLFEKLLFIKNFNDDVFQNYTIDVSQNLIEIDEGLVDKINIKNATNFSKEFISYLLALYLNDIFFIVGNIEDILIPKFSNNRERHNWKYFYIVKKELKNFDFISFTNDISERLKEKIDKTYNFNFKNYLLQFILNTDLEIIDSIFCVAEKIINYEFGLSLDMTKKLVFKRNTIKQTYEYSFEALEKLGKPSKVEEITRKIIELYPNYETDENRVRSSLRRKYGFIPIGRNSVFGLKKWENELENFKGGTIRSITTEYLENFNTPIHLSEIMSYVLKYRPESNEKSIYYNLKIDESQTFCFFKNSYIGLKYKKYSADFEILKTFDFVEHNSWEDRFENLKKFIFNENRLPFSSGVSEEEIKLFRWINIQKRKFKSNELDEHKKNLIYEILNKFPVINARRHLNSIQKYDKLLEFIRVNNRLPIANKQGEENLYQFFYKQNKLYKNNELNTMEITFFTKINEILKNHKW